MKTGLLIGLSFAALAASVGVASASPQLCVKSRGGVPDGGLTLRAKCRPAESQVRFVGADSFADEGGYAEGKKCGSTYKNGVIVVFPEGCSATFKAACSNGFTCHDYLPPPDGGCLYGECND